MNKFRRAELRKHRRIRRNKPKKWCQIYVLKDADGFIRCVGQTTLLPSERLRWYHKDLAKRLREGRSLSPIMTWFKNVIDTGDIPTIEIIDENGMWDISEAVWIDRLRRDGHPLLNVQSVVAD